MFNDSLSIKGITVNNINSSNTDIKIIPYSDQITREFINYTKYNLTWTATKLTQFELEIQLNFNEPESISTDKIQDQI